MEFFVANDASSLAQQLSTLLQSPDQLVLMAQNNFKAALQMSMPRIIQQYVRSFDMQQRVRILKAYSQLRRTRRWAPARNWTIRQLERNLSASSHSFPEEIDS